MSDVELVHVFYSAKPSMNTHLKDGYPIHFTDHRYATSIPAHIEELTKLAKDPSVEFIYIKEGEETMDARALDPVWQLKEKLRAELIVEMGSSNQLGDLGKSQAGSALANALTSQQVAGTQASTSGVKVGAIASSNK